MLVKTAFGCFLFESTLVYIGINTNKEVLCFHWIYGLLTRLLACCWW